MGLLSLLLNFVRPVIDQIPGPVIDQIPGPQKYPKFKVNHRFRTAGLELSFTFLVGGTHSRDCYYFKHTIC